MFELISPARKVTLRDSTLREGLDVAGVDFSTGQRLHVAKLLDRTNVPEIEVVAPGKVFQDLEFAERLQAEGLNIKTSGLIYAFNQRAQEEIKETGRHLHRFDLLMPVTPKRRPYENADKIRLLLETLDFSLRCCADVGVGFPQAAQADMDFLLAISSEAVRHGAQRVTIYDTSGSLDPFEVYRLIRKVKEDLKTPLFFHGHNDLGMATANSLAAVYAGADGLDVTVNGLGDRAGNASLEQVALSLGLRGFETGVVLKNLKSLSEGIEETSGLRVSKLAPVVGENIFVHKSPGHMEHPELFEAFDPEIVGFERKLTDR